MSSPLVLIMAGGLGKRMCSDIPKVLHCVQGKPMLVHVIENSWKIKPQKIILIVGHYRPIIEETLRNVLPPNIFYCLEFALQPEAQGTGHAIKCALDHLGDDYSPVTPVLILSGDTPLVTPETMNLLLTDLNNAKIMTTRRSDPSGYGRIVIKDQCFQKIIEHKDCSQEELLITLVNTGIYTVTLKILDNYIPQINNQNAQQEYYLTDLFGLLVLNRIAIQIYEMPVEHQLQLSGVNTKKQLEELNKLLDTLNTD